MNMSRNCNLMLLVAYMGWKKAATVPAKEEPLHCTLVSKGSKCLAKPKITDASGPTWSPGLSWNYMTRFIQAWMEFSSQYASTRLMVPARRVVYEKLDRSCANASWINLFPDMVVENLPIIGSDHGPICVSLRARLTVLVFQV